jgi:FlaA1/EpsC-like NDP-sugar epimerase
MSRRLLVVGAGAHGNSVAEAALLSSEWSKVIFLDESWPDQTDSLGCRLVGKAADVAAASDQLDGAIAAVGNN